MGREAQLAVAISHLERLDQPHGALLTITGEPGMGKTRLAEEIGAIARDRGARVAWATSWHGDGAPPLWPWVQILRQVVGSDSALGGFAPESPAASPAARFEQCEAVAGAVHAEAARTPLVVVLDDLQWADSASIRVLAHLAVSIRDRACLLLGTCRPDELAREHLEELVRTGTTLALPPLPEDAAAELLRASVGEAVSGPATSAVVHRSGGNALFVREFGQLMAQSGRLDVAPAAVPDAVSAVIERRLARLPEDTVSVLRTAAVAGRRFPVDVVARIGAVDPDEAGARLAEAASVGILAWDPDSNRFAFGHDLVHDVVLEGISPAIRRELHLRAAGVYEERLADEDSYHTAVADHLERAGTPHDLAASAHWEEAALRAQRLLAYDEAAALFARAARTAGADRNRHAALLVDEGDSWLLAGDLDAARARFGAAAAEARAQGAPELVARAVLGIGTGPVAWEVPIGNPGHAAEIEAALDALPEDSFDLRSMLLARLSVSAATPDSAAASLRRAEEALRIARDLGNPRLTGQALAAVNDALSGPEHAVQRRDNADAIVGLAVEAGDRVLELLGYRFRIVADLETGDVAAADRHVSEFARLAGQLRQPLVSWYVPLFRGMRALLNGDVESATKWCAQVGDAAEATGSHNAEMLAATLEFGIEVAAEHPTDPGLLDDLFDVDPADWGSYAAGMAMVKFKAGERDAASSLLRLHAGNRFTRVADDSEYLVTLLMFGRVAAGLGDRSACEAVYDRLLPHAGMWAVDGIAACCWGPVELELARLAVTLGRRSEAAGHHVRARAAVEAVGAPLLLRDVELLGRACAELAGAVPDEQPEAADVAANRLVREGQYWTISYAGRTIRMKDAKGLRDLARLLARPGVEIHVLDLAGAPEHAELKALGDSGGVGDLLDARARAEYRRRVADLEVEIADAEACADIARAERARSERDFVAAELGSALGLSGRTRRPADPAERARKAVTGRIRLTIDRIDAEHPDLGRHLTNSVRTGTFCVYTPEDSVDWTV